LYRYGKPRAIKTCKDHTTTVKTLFKSIHSWPLRFHLMMMLLLLALPTLALIIYFGFDQRNKALNDEFLETKRLVNNISFEQYNLTGDAEQLMNVLALMPVVQQHKSSEVEPLLSSILSGNKMYTNITICDKSGMVWASALHSSRRVFVKNSFVFNKVIATKHFSSGEYSVGAISRKSGIGFGYPVLDSKGDVDGVIFVFLDFDFLNDILKQSDLPIGSQFILADHTGTVIFMNPKSDNLVGTHLSESVFQSIKESPKSTLLKNMASIKNKKIFSYGNLSIKGEKSPYLYILASIPIQESLGWANRAMFFQVAILCICLLVVLILVSLIGKFTFVDQINKLRVASELLAQGDRGVFVSDTHMSKELGELARAFNGMARQLTYRERELHELNITLSQKVMEETERRLQQERLLARQTRLAAIGEMISAIAHQWRQPLTTLGVVIQGIKIAWERSLLDRPYLVQAVESAKKQIDYMSNTIEDFRNFFNSDKIVEDFDVREKIAEVVQLVSAQFTTAKVGLDVVDAAVGVDLIIRGFQNEFKQSVLNLVSNSFDAVLAKYGAWDSAHSDVGIVKVCLDRTQDKVIIEVRDNGCGIQADYGDKIFEPYFTTKQDGKGTGIGLYMTKLIVEESMGGRLSFTSSTDETVFRIEMASAPLSRENHI